MSETRAFKAGRMLAKSIIEMIHLMYQSKTALKFMRGLMGVLLVEYDKRKRK